MLLNVMLSQISLVPNRHLRLVAFIIQATAEMHGFSMIWGKLDIFQERRDPWQGLVMQASGSLVDVDIPELSESP